MLDILQNIGERDLGRRPYTPVVPHHNNNNNNFHHNRGTQNYLSFLMELPCRGHIPLWYKH